MTFVFSFWYIVLAILVLGVIGLVIAFVKMDKKDRELIKDFVDETNKQAPVEESKTAPQEETAPVVEENKPEQPTEN